MTTFWALLGSFDTLSCLWVCLSGASLQWRSRSWHGLAIGFHPLFIVCHISRNTCKNAQWVAITIVFGFSRIIFLMQHFLMAGVLVRISWLLINEIGCPWSAWRRKVFSVATVNGRQSLVSIVVIRRRVPRVRLWTVSWIQIRPV